MTRGGWGTSRALLVVGAVLFFGCGRLGYGLGDADGGRGGMDAATADSGGGGGGTDGGSGDGSTSAGRCGDGVVGPGEQCDEPDDVNGDGCDTDCTFSCESTDACDDGLACNGVEVCDPTAHRCALGTPLADGTACGAGVECRSGMCVTDSCGDGTIDPGEDCDDMNVVDGDGCDTDCTWSCTVSADCNDGRDCNGRERCTAATHTCGPGAEPADYTTCERDANPATFELCVGGVCIASECGDGFTDTRHEECDDHNGINGDGCENECRFSCHNVEDCRDGMPCNGDETCDTGPHVCRAGAPPANGSPCPGGMCMGGVCVHDDGGTALPADAGTSS